MAVQQRRNSKRLPRRMLFLATVKNGNSMTSLAMRLLKAEQAVPEDLVASILEIWEIFSETFSAIYSEAADEEVPMVL